MRSLYRFLGKLWGMILNGRSNYSFADDKYKFTGKERDTETGYDYFGARFYESRLGRWLQVDPLADKYPGWNPYNYCLNNPLKFVDKEGSAVFFYMFEVRGVLSLLTSSVSVGLAIDHRGHWGLFYGGSVGLANGEGFILGMNVGLYPSMDSYDKIEGIAINLGGFFADLDKGGSLELNWAAASGDIGGNFSVTGFVLTPSTGLGGAGYLELSGAKFFAEDDIFYGLIVKALLMRAIADELGISVDEVENEFIPSVQKMLTEINAGKTETEENHDKTKSEEKHDKTKVHGNNLLNYAPDQN